MTEIVSPANLLTHIQKCNLVIVEGKYKEKQYPNGKLYWELCYWRVYPIDQEQPSEWYQIHGNQKKDIGALKLIRDIAPVGELNP